MKSSPTPPLLNRASASGTMRGVTARHLSHSRHRAVHVSGVVLALLIFLVDMARPLGDAIGILYVLVIVLGLWTEWTAYPLVAGIGATVLLAIDLVLGWSEPPPAFVFVNRPLMVLVFIATAVLVTRFKRLEQHAFSNVQQLGDLKRALDAAAIVATTDVTGRITYVNDKFVEISGYNRDELIGQDHRIINSSLHSKEFIRDLWRTIANGRVWHGEIRNRAKDGHYYWVDTTIVPFLDDRGKPYQYIAIRADITARKAAEERLTHQAALARVGQLAAVVAHEVKNPLAGIKGAIQVLMSRRPRGDRELVVMTEIVSRVDALNELIGDLILFARPRAPKLAPVNVRSVLADAADMLRRDASAEGVDVTVVADDLSIDADADLLRATLLNLLINASQAMSGKGRIALEVRAEGAEIAIDVRDTGPGIPPQLRDEIFEPFFTTKARGGGLGLPIARRTAELHGGTLTLGCPPEGGTVMTLRLPLRPPATAAMADMR
jgi:PAS domain S-box-containing protein